jgi:dolichol-phosphate mannosyltransferase
MSTSDVLVAVCTLCEAANIIGVLEQLRASVPGADLLVIDDDSNDHTADLAGQFALQDGRTRVIVRKETGLGGAIRLAMKIAVEGQYKWLVNLDADFSHDPAQIPRLIDRAIQAPDVDVVIGSRYVAGGRIEGWPLYRRWMSRWVNRIAKSRLGLGIADCSGSMRCYRVESLQRMGLDRLSSNGYAVLEEVLVVMQRTIDAKFAEVPITFTDRHAGQSKLTFAEAIRSVRKIWSLGQRT